jgi:hypothetical protein
LSVVRPATAKTCYSVRDLPHHHHFRFVAAVHGYCCCDTWTTDRGKITKMRTRIRKTVVDDNEDEPPRWW